MNHFFSHGKLLLTSEYMILDGALAFAIPTQFGQKLTIQEIEDSQSLIIWDSRCQNQLWVKTKINYKNWKILESNLTDSALFIMKIMKEIQKLSSDKFKKNTSYLIKSNLEFPQNFGLGSSSTLITNLSKWAKINPFELNENILGGSGYDIAVAQNSSAILYQIKDKIRHIEKINFLPKFKNELLFIHLNKKQNSREGIKLYRSKNKSQQLIQKFSEITKSIIQCNDINSFSELMNLHEKKLSQFLGLKTAKEIYFPDCPVFIKSLGAWGGDFIMSRKFNGYQKYFKEKGFESIFTWQDLILEK